MTDGPDAGTHDAEPGRPPDTASGMLRAARESAGLSVDSVAQHLKLAPRQIKALEDGAWSELPGRTFVRGFARNYARLLQLDPVAVVAALPDAVQVPAFDKSAIGASTRTMGEMPVSESARRGSWSRWAIPLALVTLIGVAAVYEYTRPEDTPRLAGFKGTGAKSAPADPVGPSPSSGTPLPNPIIASDPGPSQPATAGGRLPEAASGTALRAEQPAATTPAPLPITTATEPLGALAGASVAAAGGPTLIISYRAPAWTDVRDANGQRLLQVTGAAGSTQTVHGTPPFELTLGNATETSVTWRGAAVDLAPHTRGSTARVRLP